MQHPAPVLTGLWPHIDQPVGPAHHIQLVLDDEDRVPRLLQPSQHSQQRLGVRRMETGRRLVQHIDDPEEARAQLGGETQPLQLAGGQGRSCAVEAEIAEAELGDRPDPAEQVRRQHPRRFAAARRAQQLGETGQRQRRQFRDRAAWPKVTASASGRSRLPPQAGHGALARNRSAFARSVRLLESAKVCIT